MRKSTKLYLKLLAMGTFGGILTIYAVAAFFVTMGFCEHPIYRAVLGIPMFIGILAMAGILINMLTEVAFKYSMQREEEYVDDLINSIEEELEK